MHYISPSELPPLFPSLSSKTFISEAAKMSPASQRTQGNWVSSLGEVCLDHACTCTQTTSPRIPRSTSTLTITWLLTQLHTLFKIYSFIKHSLKYTACIYTVYGMGFPQHPLINNTDFYILFVQNTFRWNVWKISSECPNLSVTFENEVCQNIALSR